MIEIDWSKTAPVATYMDENITALAYRNNSDINIVVNDNKFTSENITYILDNSPDIEYTGHFAFNFEKAGVLLLRKASSSGYRHYKLEKGIWILEDTFNCNPVFDMV